MCPVDEVVPVLRADAGYETQAGDRQAAVQTYERLLAAMLAARPDLLGNLEDAAKVSSLYRGLSNASRQAGDAVKAAGIDERRHTPWQQWDDVSGTFAWPAQAGGINTMHLEVEAESGDSMLAESANASADPFIFIDPSFAGAQNYHIVVSDGVGNALPASTVPEPGTLGLMVTALR